MIMPSLKKLRIGAMIVALLVVMIESPLAQECLSPSPSITQMGETPYDPIEVRKLTPSEFANLSKLFQSLTGDWRGEAEHFFCRSDQDPSDIAIERSIIRAKVQVDRNSNLNLSANLYSESDRTSYQKNLWLYLNDLKLRLNNDNSTGNVELQTVSEHKVAFFARHVLQTGTSGGSARQEPFYSVTRTPDEFTIEMRLYVRGKLSSGYTWTFSKK